MNTRTAAVNEASTCVPDDRRGRQRGVVRRPATDRPTEGTAHSVADILYVGLVIVGFAILVLAARGLERL